MGPPVPPRAKGPTDATDEASLTFLWSALARIPCRRQEAGTRTPTPGIEAARITVQQLSRWIKGRGAVHMFADVPIRVALGCYHKVDPKKRAFVAASAVPAAAASATTARREPENKNSPKAPKSESTSERLDSCVTFGQRSHPSASSRTLYAVRAHEVCAPRATLATGPCERRRPIEEEPRSDVVRAESGVGQSTSIHIEYDPRRVRATLRSYSYIRC